MVNRRRSPRGDAAPPFRNDDGRWQELLDISARIFARKGYRSTTLQDIADEFGVLKGSLYHYIRSKDDLLYEVVKSVLDTGLRNLRDHADSPDSDVIDRIRSVTRGHVLYLIENLVATTVLLHEFDQLSEQHQRDLPIREYQTVLEDLITGAKDDSRLRADVDPQLTALAVLGATNWVYRWYRPGGSRSPEQIADYFADLLVGGLLVHAEHATATAVPSRTS
ncbi:MAG: TetR/AcrR family transcriptional regulator [Pseudonocardia sp.]|nr:TetR/AcrR family transcriptional regulator [Pseudonocardia sp.]